MVEEVICPKCSHKNEPEAWRCVHCQAELTNPHKVPYALNPRILAYTWVWDKVPKKAVAVIAILMLAGLLAFLIHVVFLCAG